MENNFANQKRRPRGCKPSDVAKGIERDKPRASLPTKPRASGKTMLGGGQRCTSSMVNGEPVEVFVPFTSVVKRGERILERNWRARPAIAEASEIIVGCSANRHTIKRLKHVTSGDADDEGRPWVLSWINGNIADNMPPLVVKQSIHCAANQRNVIRKDKRRVGQ